MTSKIDPRGHYCEHFFSICACHFLRSEKRWILGDFGQGPAAGAEAAWSFRFCRFFKRFNTPCFPWRGCGESEGFAPAAGPWHSMNRCSHGWRHYGTRDLWFCFRFCCIGSAWNRLGVIFCEPGDALKNSAGPSDLQLDLLGLPSSILSDLGCNFRGLETSFFATNRTLDVVLSMHSFNVIIGINFGGFIILRGTSRTWKTIKIGVLSFKIEGRQEDIRN